MKRLLFLVALAIAGAAVAQEGSREAVVSTSGTTAVSAKLGNGWKHIYCTTSTHFKVGESDVTAATTDLAITSWQLYLPKPAYIAFILDSSTGTCSIYRIMPGPTGVPPSHASAGSSSSHAVTNIGTASYVAAPVTATVTAGTLCFCSGDTDSVTTCSLSSTTLTMAAASGNVAINYVCFTS